MHSIFRFAALAVLAIAATLTFAQSPKPAVKPAVTVQTPAMPAVKQPTVSDVKATPLPTLTENESLKLENLQMKFALLNQQQKELGQTYTSLIQSIIAEHPGYTWDAANSRLIPAPTPDAKN